MSSCVGTVYMYSTVDYYAYIQYVYCTYTIHLHLCNTVHIQYAFMCTVHILVHTVCIGALLVVCTVH